MILFKQAKSLLTMVIIAFLSGCAAKGFHTSIIPLSDGEYDMVSTAETEDSAYKNAELSAKAECEKTQRALKVSSHKSVYQGISKKEKQDIEVTDVAMAWVTGASHKEDRSDDYKVTMRFVCS